MSKFNLQVNRIASDFITDPSTNEQIHISTVKLPFPHVGGDYATMIFGGVLNEYQERYYRCEDAYIGHREAIKKVYASFI